MTPSPVHLSLAAQPEPTPAERRRQKRRDEIIEAAQEVFLVEGEAGLSMRRLAERIDYSPAALYKYFSSKEDLLQEIREQFFDRLLRRLDRVIAENDLSLACLRESVVAYIECGLERPNHYRMAFSAGSTKVAPAVGTKTFEASMLLQRMIAEGVSAGLFRPVDAATAAASLWSAMHGLTLLLVEYEDFPSAKPGNEHVTRPDVIAFHADLIARGLAAP